MICTKRSKTGSWKSNLSTKLVTPLSHTRSSQVFFFFAVQTTETRLFREEESGSQKFGLVDQVMM